MSLLLTIGLTTMAQSSDCEITKTNGGGFTTTIESVVCNDDGTHDIVIRIEHDGCGGPTCKELSHYSVEADAGTYSDISVTVISGNMTYGNIDLGPNLGSDPFDGFKVDETNDIGGGDAGIFTISYTLTGGLQDQQVSAKAGNNGQIASFTVQDFEYVMNCNETECDGGGNDSDGDGCTDDVDDYPNDPTRCFDIYFPAEGNGTLAFEDMWPGKGDYDFNDLVIDYRFHTVTNSGNYCVEMTGTFTIKAFGASFHNGFGFQIGDDTWDAADLTVSGYSLGEGYITLDNNGTEAGQSIPTIIVYDDAYNEMQWPGSGIGVNTTPGITYVTPATLTISIDFETDTYTYNDLDIANFNPFIIRDLDRSIEVHLPDHAPTDLANSALLGTSHDDSDPATGKYYKTENNLPWAINIYETFAYPNEKVDIINAHLKFGTWAESGGSQFNDWYKDLPGYRNSSNIYQVP